MRVSFQSNPPPPPPASSPTLDEASARQELLRRQSGHRLFSRKSAFRRLTLNPRSYSRQFSSDSIDIFDIDDGDEDGIHYPKEAIRQVTYDDRNHLSVMLQMHGSVWPRVLPYALFNCLLTLCIYILKWNGYNITMDKSGHKFMSTMVAFLVVSRASIVYSRFMEARAHLSACYKSCRELVHHLAVLSMEDKGTGAKVWRQEVAYRTILLLRVTMAVLEFQSSNRNAWEISELDLSEQEDMKEALMLDDSDSDDSDSDDSTTNNNNPNTNSNNNNNSNHPKEEEKNKRSSSSSKKKKNTTIRTSRVGRWAHGLRSISDENFRAPIILAYNLRREIMAQRGGGLLKKRFKHVNLELKMLDYVSEFVQAYHGLKKLITTPFPFPLVQMARTFLFFWVFTLPLALCNADAPDPLEDILIMFFITYGFIGLEYVSMEMDDPFGDDPMDFDDLGMAQMVFEDIYITIYKIDGDRSAYDLRKRIIGRMNQGTAMQNYHREYQYGIRMDNDNDDDNNDAGTGGNTSPQWGTSNTTAVAAGNDDDNDNDEEE